MSNTRARVAISLVIIPIVVVCHSSALPVSAHFSTSKARTQSTSIPPVSTTDTTTVVTTLATATATAILTNTATTVPVAVVPATESATPVPAFGSVHAKYRQVLPGSDQVITGHTSLPGTVTLRVSYGNHVQSLTTTLLSAETFTFIFKPDYTGSSVRLAQYWLYFSRNGTVIGSQRGDFIVFPHPVLHLSVTVMTPYFYAGDDLRVDVHGLPYTKMSLTASDRGGHVFGKTSGKADGTGTWHASLPIHVHVGRIHKLTLSVTGVDGPLHDGKVTFASLEPHPLTLLPLTLGAPSDTLTIKSFTYARRLAEVDAAGSMSQARENAASVIQALKIDLDVLSQWTSKTGVRDAGYYTQKLAEATSYTAAVALTADVLVDDTKAHMRMRAVMPQKAVMVSISSQSLRTYQDGVLQYSSYVTTGQPVLPTVTGHFNIYLKQTPFEFHSPWPIGSPFYYAPSWVTYWMPFYQGYGLHDSPWRQNYGPNTNITGDGAYSAEPTGSHGCINLPAATAAWIWNWAVVGTDVVVYDSPQVSGGTAGL